MGRQYDDSGNLKNWWKDQTKDKFLEKSQCIIWQYGNYTAKAVNKTLNGVNTQGEKPRLPGLQKYSPHQMFWISAANTWCSKYRNKALEKRIKTGVHSPGMFRVQGPFSNSREFSSDFQCAAGTRMNPVKKCEVW